MKKKPAKDRGIAYDSRIPYGLLVLFFISYLVTEFWLFGLFVGLCIVWAVGLEFATGATEHGWMHELKETAIALLLALLLWFGAGYILNTPSPLNAIVSCSMLPHIQRGDMVILSGDRIAAPEVNVASLPDYNFVQVYRDGQSAGSVKGSLYSACVQSQNPLCRDFVAEPQRFSEKNGPLTIGYEKCEIVYPKSGERQAGPCAAWLEVNGVRYYEDLSNDVVVYQPNSEEYYSRVGDIIHRAYIKLRDSSSGKVYFLTKGDNNPMFDIQVYDEKLGMGNRPVEVERSKGRILFSVPVVGYLKLFISPSAIATPDGCDQYYAKYAPQ